MWDESRDEPTDAQLVEILAIAKATAYACGALRYEADDVAQTTTMKLWARWDHETVAEVRESGSPQWRSYIRRAAKNVHYDLVKQHRRRNQRNYRASGGRPGLLPQRPGTETSSPPGDPFGVDAYVARDFIIDQIIHLPARQRTVAYLIIMEELTVREVAEQLNIQPQSVRKHFRAAKEALTDRVQEHERQWL